jgi:formate/nitrite transporter FocA (FNT family)
VLATTKFGHVESPPVIELIKKIAEAKTIGYEDLGVDGLYTVFIKAIFCNWMVTLGAVMALTSTSTSGKILAMWLPIITFFAQGFEHAVVNMFVIPAGIMLGADVTISQWWLWNQIPVTLGNIVGGALFTGAALYLTHKNTKRS